MEDFITWVNSSAIKRHVMEYNDSVSQLELDNQFLIKNCNLIVVF